MGLFGHRGCLGWCPSLFHDGLGHSVHYISATLCELTKELISFTKLKTPAPFSLFPHHFTFG